MKTSRNFALFLILGSLVSWADTIRPQVQPLPVISPDLSATLLHAGDTFSVSILVGGVTDLSGFQFQFSFNPSVVMATNVTTGSFFPSGSSFTPGAINNVAGSIGLTMGTSSGGGMTGTGTLAVIFFTALAPGTSSLDLSGVQLLDSSGRPMSLVISNGMVTVSPATAVPEPATLTLLMLGAGPVVARRLWKKRDAN